MNRYLIILLLLIPRWGTAQETEAPNWSLNGYMKNLQTGLFFNTPLADEFLQDNLLHNRLNFRWYPSDRLTFRAEVRNRAFFGDLVRANPDYADQVDDVNNDYADLSVVLLDSKSWVIHSMLDRLSLTYYAGDWEITLGRQRINWGISNVWNPSDLYNAFAFTDFDYEERPGSDALLIRRYTGFASSVELAVKAADHLRETVIAGLWKFNRWNYDFQVLAGYARNEWALGVGWAGNIGDASFKGESTLFIPNSGTAPRSFALTLGLDYVFSNSLYGAVGYLYNSNGDTRTGITNLFAFELSAKNLYPYRHAVFLQGSYPATPLINIGTAIIYSPVEVHPLFLNPVFTYSIATNWDLDLIGQVVFNRSGDTFTSPLQAVFLRTKFSF